MLSADDKQSRLGTPSTEGTPLAARSRTSSKADGLQTPSHLDRTASRLSHLSIDPNGDQVPFAGEDVKSAETAEEAEDQLDASSTRLEHTSSSSLNRDDPPPDVYDQHELEFQAEQTRRREFLKGELLDKTKAHASYYTTSKKEQWVLDFVANFNRQYTQLYPGRKELLLCPPNHFGLPKFVCTTIRPTQLPYKQLYDYRGCTRFVSEFLSYQPLEPAHELPQMIPGPSYTLRLQQGNSFDYSILLVSLLRGVGYDAYVVSGYASRTITLMDESRVDSDAVGIPSPLGSMDANKAAKDGENSKKEGEGAAPPNKYKVKPPRQLRSQFLLKQEEKAKLREQQEEEARRKREAEARAMDNDDDDELKGLRVHAWCLVLPGKREVAEAFFIEPSTGRIYSTDNEHYLGVESVFSSTNYWVNMQVCYEGLKGISFDLGDNAKWEFVLLDNTQPGGSDAIDDEEDKAGDNASDDESEPKNEILDLPPSWVEKLSVSKEDFESRCPSGARTILYRNARYEVFAEYFRKDGMVSRTTFFAEDSKNYYGEIREAFQNRRDKLRERIRVPYDGKIHEFFDPGRPHGLKEHIIIDDRTKEMHFYPAARSDGLVKRVDDTTKIMEYFTDREDRLIYRSVTFDGDEEEEDAERGAMIKMAEKFDRSPDLPAHSDAAKKTYFLKDDKIRVIYHLEDGKIIPSTREFKKPTSEQKINFLDQVVSFEVNPYAKPPKKQELFAELLQLLGDEGACLSAIKASDREVQEILASRQAEEKDVALVISVYDTIRNQTKLPSEEKKETYKEEEEAKAADLDYLSPFLVNYSDPNHLTREEALQVKDACLKSFKERLIEKANIIQGRLDEVTAEYQRRQLAYSRNADSMTIEETEEYVKFCNDALFKIHILEKRLAKHKETAPERYIELDARLKADARLHVAFSHG